MHARRNIHMSILASSQAANMLGGQNFRVLGGLYAWLGMLGGMKIGAKVETKIEIN